MSLTLEEWAPIKGFEDYEVSTAGRVRRCVKGLWSPVGTVLKPNKINKGYLQVSLYNSGKRQCKLVHVLVAEAFIPNPEGLPQVNHLGKNDDNKVDSLEWRSEAGNMLHAVKTGRKGDGVSFNKRSKKWRAGYCPKLNTRVYLGEYSSKEDALAARTKAVESIPDVL